MLIISFLLLITVFLQSALLQANIVLPFILTIAINRIDDKTLLLIFASGLLNDILGLEKVGQSSLFFLLMTLFVYWYQKKYKIKNPAISLLIFLLVIVPYNFLVNKNINPGIVVIETAAFIVFYYLTSVFFNNQQKIIYD